MRHRATARGPSGRQIVLLNLACVFGGACGDESVSARRAGGKAEDLVRPACDRSDPPELGLGDQVEVNVAAACPATIESPSWAFAQGQTLEVRPEPPDIAYAIRVRTRNDCTWANGNFSNTKRVRGRLKCTTDAERSRLRHFTNGVETPDTYSRACHVENVAGDLQITVLLDCQVDWRFGTPSSLVSWATNGQSLIIEVLAREDAAFVIAREHITPY